MNLCPHMNAIVQEDMGLVKYLMVSILSLYLVVFDVEDLGYWFLDCPSDIYYLRFE